jgi:hypothetical protein
LPVFVLLLAAAAAGCVTPEPVQDLRPDVAVLLPADCAALGWRCTDAPEEMVVQGLDLRPTGQETVGIWIEGLTKPLLLHDVTVAGFASGVHVGPSACSACPVRLRQVHLLGPAPEGPLDLSDPLSIGVLDEGGAGDLELSDMEVRGYRIGIAATPLHEGPVRGKLGLERVDVTCGMLGVYAAAQRIETVDVQVRGCSEGLGLQALGASTLAGGSATGSDVGARLSGDWRVTGFEASGNRLGIVHHEGLLDAEGLTITGNGAADDPLSGGLVSTGSGSVHGSTLAGNLGVALQASVTDLPEGEARTFDATGNWWGAATGPTPHPARAPGLGDSFSGPVEVVPFLAAPPASA